MFREYLPDSVQGRSAQYVRACPQFPSLIGADSNLLRERQNCFCRFSIHAASVSCAFQFAGDHPSESASTRQLLGAALGAVTLRIVIGDVAQLGITGAFAGSGAGGGNLDKSMALRISTRDRSQHWCVRLSVGARTDIGERVSAVLRRSRLRVGRSRRKECP